MSVTCLMLLQRAMTDILAKSMRPSGQAIESRVGGETVLLHVESGAYYGLDTVGTRIWELLKEGVEPRAICRRIAEEYAVDAEEAETDARRFLEDLMANGIAIEA